MPRPHQSTTGTDTGGGGGDSHRTRSSATSTDVDICLDDGPRVPRLSPGIQEASASSMTTTKIITSATSAMAESTTRRKGATGANIRNGGTKRRNQKNRLSSSPLQKKKEEILQVLSEDKIDLWRLRELALTEYGFVNDSIRKRAWPLLVGITGNIVDQGIMPGGANINTSKIEVDSCLISVIDPMSLDTKAARRGVVARCLDAEQIDRDVARCTWHLLTGSQRQRRRNMAAVIKKQRKMESLLRRKQRRLANLINLVLVQSYDAERIHDDENLHYYQGFHDVSCIFLNALGGGRLPNIPSSNSNPNPSHVDQAAQTATAMGLDLPSSVLLQVSQSHFRDAMGSSFQTLTAALNLVVMPLIAALDQEIHSKLLEVDVQPFFAVSWIITWFSHDVRDTALVKRLFDVFLVSHPLMPVYMSVAMVLHPINRLILLRTESEFSAIHNALTHLPRNSCNVGWKYRSGLDGGYVSDDGEANEDDDSTIESSAFGEGSVFSDDMSCSDVGSIGRDTSRSSDYDDDSMMASGSQAPSMISAMTPILSPANERVPFQELIDISISFMRRIPPRRLVPLAKRYYSDDAIQPFLDQVSSIAFFRPPPLWALVPTVENSFLNGTAPKPSDDSSTLAEIQFGLNGVLADPTAVGAIQALVASGLGPDGEGEIKLARRRRKRFIRRCVVGVSLVTVSIFMVQYYFNVASQLSSSTQRSRDLGSVTNDVSLKDESGTGMCTRESSSPHSLTNNHTTESNYCNGRNNTSELIQRSVVTPRSTSDSAKQVEGITPGPNTASDKKLTPRHVRGDKSVYIVSHQLVSAKLRALRQLILAKVGDLRRTLHIIMTKLVLRKE